jgi:hypothetical protein
MRAKLAISAALWLAAAPSAAQIPRTPEGKPDLSGFWQAMNTAQFDIQDHPAAKGVPAGRGVVVGDELPYLPAARVRKEQNAATRETADPLLKCFLPGVPRIMYLPYPFQIFQTPTKLGVLYEYVHAVREIYLDSVHPPGPLEFWMGDSRARWQGDTLVVDVTHFNDQTWFDRAGNFHSDALRVVERFTPISPYHLMYEATMEDPNVFTRSWTIRMPIYRRLEQNTRLHEYRCTEFVEELMYGHIGIVDPATGERNEGPINE